jgi:hypothetical protein
MSRLLTAMKFARRYFLEPLEARIAPATLT